MDQMAEIGGRNGMIISSSFHDHHLQQQLASSFMNAAASSASSSDNATSTTEEEENYDDGIDDHHQLQLWAAIERLPTFTRLRTSLIDHKILNDGKREEAAGKTLIDVTKLRALERRVLVEKLVTKIEDDNRLLLQKLKQRIEKLTLLLGSPGCGKTTLLQAIAGRLNQSLQVTGEISYNGYKFNEFVPQKTSTYISQNDLHISEMTVRETLDFSARCQGIGSRGEIMKEVSRREKQAGIIPEPDLDTYMKILGLDICADTIVGDAMNRGISGGQKRRLTTGEMIIGPTRALFMDEISNGLDSSTTFQIVTCLQQSAHITDSTILVSLLQPAPETFNLFDDIILMAERTIVYQGPCSNVLEFFEHCGFKCPPRKGVADFLQEAFVQEVLQLIELDEIKDALVGIPDIRGISHEQRKRLTIAVELVSNPSIIFMDEPTTGLDARAAAIVMRVVKNIVQTMRTVVCTIHQPSIDIFAAFDELILMKGGGQMIYSGELGQHSSKLIEYFEGISGVPKIEEIYNPATWMLEVTSPSTEAQLGLDFARLYKMSSLCQDDEQDFLMVLGAMYIFVQVMGISNSSSVIPFIATERTLVYRERFAGMYSSWAYSSTQVIIEIPYSFLQALLFSTITYPAIDFYWTAHKVFLYFYTMFCTMLFFNYFGMMLVALTPSYQAASIFASFCHTMLNLFAGFLIPGPKIPKWWIWAYWICPTAWSLNGFITSQYGDIKKEIIVHGEPIAISVFLESNYGYQYKDLPVVATVLLAFPLFFAAAFAYAISKLNFQKR
ncbi:hypothetical protein LWI29_021728 [Acer saccharum]|uniref:ABC transporter domain-containing protein n=1 Tax=Acer saccharum TaxID=4024 RepID=A0AA39VTY1_ACESA|nr:hypothetical protein LWI29_021728 [Acer saccharum]